MTLSYPNIVDATGYWNNFAGNGKIQVLTKNSGGYGYVRLDLGNNETGVITNTLETCRQPLTGPLSERETGDIFTVFNFGFAKAYKCNSDIEQNCSVTPPTCTNRILTSQLLNFPIRAYNATTPAAPTNLTITPGDKTLRIQWNEVINISIFAYLVEIRIKATDVLVREGYTPNDSRDITVANLINNTTYTIWITALSHSAIFGQTKTGEGTPTSPYVNITANVTDGINPLSNVLINIDGKTCITGTDGKCTIYDLMPNTGYTINASKTGYRCSSGCGIFNSEGGGTINIEMTFTSCLDTFMPDKSLLYLPKTKPLILTGNVVNVDNVNNKEIGIIFTLPDGSIIERTIGTLAPCEKRSYSYDFENIPEKIYGRWFLQQSEKIGTTWNPTEVASIQIQEPFSFGIVYSPPGPNYLAIGAAIAANCLALYGIHRFYKEK